ncbi:MAG: hypothetical protein ABL971_04165 [Vicinamibacterales bacterium]
MTLVQRVVCVVLFLEVGILLTVVPWSTYWDRNYFTDGLPWLRHLMRNTFVRGAVSGLGAVNLAAAVMDAWALAAALRLAWHGALRRAKGA